MGDVGEGFEATQRCEGENNEVFLPTQASPVVRGPHIIRVESEEIIFIKDNSLVGRVNNIETRFVDDARGPADQRISKNHGKFIFDNNNGGRVSFCDHSTRGTTLHRGADPPVDIKDATRQLRNGDILSFGSSCADVYSLFQFRIEGLEVNRDEEIKCIECQVYFRFAEGEQTFFANQHYSPPRRCTLCRARKKERYNSEKKPIPTKAKRMVMKTHREQKRKVKRVVKWG